MTKRPNRSSIAGAAYLDLRKLARETGRPTDELMQLYGLEGFVDRLTQSGHHANFVLKGGVLLAAYADRRPTRDIDFAIDQIAGELTAIHTITNEILAVAAQDGLEFNLAATTVEEIREHETYPSIRAKVVGTLSTAQIRFHIDTPPLLPRQPSYAGHLLDCARATNHSAHRVCQDEAARATTGRAGPQSTGTLYVRGPHHRGR